MINFFYWKKTSLEVEWTGVFKQVTKLMRCNLQSHEPKKAFMWSMKCDNRLHYEFD